MAKLDDLSALSADEQRRAVQLARKTCFWTQADLGRKAGISQSKVSLFESGTIELPDVELKRVWRELKQRYSELYDEAGHEAKELGLNLLAGGPDLEKWGKLVRRHVQEASERDAQEEIRLRKVRRTKAGMTLHELSKLIGCSHTRLSQFESGTTVFTKEELEKWDYELTKVDPWFRYATMNDFCIELYTRSEMQRREIEELRQRMAIMEELLRVREQLNDELLEARAGDQVLLDEYEKALPEKMREIDRLRAHREKLTAKK